MVSVLPVLLALAVGADSPPVEQPTRPAVHVLAWTGVGLIGVGVGFGITGLAGSNARAPVLEWREDAARYSVGGIALIGAGLCLVTIAALLTPWHFPALALFISPGGASVAVAVRWP